MRRVVILGRGGAGKSTLARRLARATGLPLIELDRHFWSPDLTPLSPSDWADRQRELATAPSWIMDGDLGPYDVLEPRLTAADTVLLLDFPLWRCAWRALRRSRERADFWVWLLTYRRRALPAIRTALADTSAAVHVLRTPAAVARFAQDTDSSNSPNDSINRRLAE